MSEQKPKRFKTFDVTCGDGTAGRISAESRRRANEAAEEMCQVHKGVDGEATPRLEG